jgi:hypothetical protein
MASEWPVDAEFVARCAARGRADVRRQLFRDARTWRAVVSLAAQPQSRPMLPPPSDAAWTYAAAVLAAPASYADRPAAVTARARCNSTAPGLHRASGSIAATVRPGAR